MQPKMHKRHKSNRKKGEKKHMTQKMKEDVGKKKLKSAAR